MVETFAGQVSGISSESTSKLKSGITPFKDSYSAKNLFILACLVMLTGINSNILVSNICLALSTSMLNFWFENVIKFAKNVKSDSVEFIKAVYGPE